MNIFVAKLNFGTDSDSLRRAFEQFGEVDSANVIMDKDTGRSKGYGFVEMPNDSEGSAAINGLDGSELDNNTIVVKQAEPREKRSFGDRNGGGGGFQRRDNNRSFGGGYDRPRRDDRNGGGYRR